MIWVLEQLLRCRSWQLWVISQVEKVGVLEAIMEFPFPRDSGLCTRFATNIVFQRSLETRISVPIVPGNKNIFNAAKLNSFKRDKIENLTGRHFLTSWMRYVTTLHGRA